MVTTTVIAVSHAEPRTGVAADSFSRLPVASHDLPTPSTVPTSPLPPTGMTVTHILKVGVIKIHN